jgi:hypothetical protein
MEKPPLAQRGDFSGSTKGAEPVTAWEAAPPPLLFLSGFPEARRLRPGRPKKFSIVEVLFLIRGGMIS